jgi:hypothetical protein
MRHRRLAIICTAACLAFTASAAEAQSNCRVIHKDSHDTVDSVMQSLGGFGAAAFLVLSPKGGKMIRGAAVAGVSSAVWNAAKSYFGSGNDVQACLEPEMRLGDPLGSRLSSPDALNPRPGFGNPALGGSGSSDILPSRIYVGPVQSTQELMRNEALNRALERQAPRLKIGDEFNFHQLGGDKLVPDWTPGKP